MEPVRRLAFCVDKSFVDVKARQDYTKKVLPKLRTSLLGTIDTSSHIVDIVSFDTSYMIWIPFLTKNMGC